MFFIIMMRINIVMTEKFACKFLIGVSLKWEHFL